LRICCSYRLRDQARPKAAKKKAPTTAILDSQSVKTSGQGGPCGYDANKKITGRKPHLLTDTPGWHLGAENTAANVQDRDGAKPLLRRATVAFGSLAKVWADSGYSGRFVTWVKQLRSHGRLHLEIVRSPKPTKGFAIQARRWVIERSFASLTKCRLLSHSAAFIHLAFSGLIPRFLSRSCGLFQHVLSRNDEVEPHRRR